MIKLNNDIKKFYTCFVFGFICLFANSGCGYTLRGTGSVLPPDVKLIAIPDVVNRTNESNLGRFLTESLREQFGRYGAVRVTDDVNEADATLNVKIVQLKSISQSSNAVTDVAQQLSTTLFASGQLIKKDKSTLWSNPMLTVTQTYGNTSGAVITSTTQFIESGLNAGDISALNQREVTRSQEQQAFNALAQQVATKIYEEAVAPEF
jgi:hypothetical protein